MGFLDWFGRKRKKEEKKSEAKIKQSFSRVRKDIKELKDISQAHNTRIMDLEVLPKKFQELQKQFTEFIMTSLTSPVSSSALHQKPNEPDEVAQFSLKGLTPHTKKAFSLIVGLLNEAGEEWLPVSQLTGDLYPGKQAEKVRNSVSNTIKPLLEKKLIERKREGNFVYIKLTKKGFEVSQRELSKNMLKKITKYYT